MKMINSTLCYIRHNGKVLMLYRNKKKNDLNEGKWVGVGGKFEPGETADQCVCREVLEETGLTITNYHLHGIIKFVSDVWDGEYMYLYSATDFTGELIENCVEGELHWIDDDEVLNLPTWEGDRYFLKPLMEGEQSINMTVEYQGDKLVRVYNN